MSVLELQWSGKYPASFSCAEGPCLSQVEKYLDSVEFFNDG